MRGISDAYARARWFLESIDRSIDRRRWVQRSIVGVNFSVWFFELEIDRACVRVCVCVPLYVPLVHNWSYGVCTYTFPGS